jgi:hypothetical protein
MSLAIFDKQLNLALGPLRSTLGIEHFAGDGYLRGSVLERKARTQPERRHNGKAARKKIVTREDRTPANGCCVIKKA